ncbi:hypothetical protein AA0111_g10701 [Alternaria arborescens]|uniref:hypothetical protein n=1 Tax=Alternaria arborescens TaxID=156630 RepID=UPI00107525A8|nr:hypothetical protein AA0111_g10701 [Alternaria arborescens]RYO18590.1 hypothetical protein AA0111_g10701 [Alternaria arborescens]
MKSLRSKASHFFRDSPSRDEKTAITDSSDVDFDAGIQDAGMKNKPSRFFRRRNDKPDTPLPILSSKSSSSTLFALVSDRVTPTELGDSFENLPEYDDDDGENTNAPLPASRNSSAMSEHEHTKGGFNLHRPKSRPSFALLKGKGMLLTVSAARGSHISHTKAQGRSISISRPRLMAQLCSPPILENPITVPFEKRPGPPPVRPPRPDSLDEETLAFMRESGTRIFLLSSNRGSASTATTSTSRSQSSSIEARLGFPSGCGTTPRSCSIESPLAARFMLDPNQRLTVRDSSDGMGYSRFSEYVRYRHDSVRAADGVDAEDREIGPIERYDASKEGDWTLEKRVSQGRDGKGGGMLFRDRWGGFHFVADI